jgi:Spy/CpxP family protein refolding chaperone
MKKTIIAAFAFVLMTAGATMAQRVYSAPFDNRGPRGGAYYDRDQVQDELKIDRLDALVGLSRKQQRELHRIEDRYDQQIARTRMTPEGYRRFNEQKRVEFLSVLTSSQRERLFALQQNNRRNNAYGYDRRDRRGY